MPKKFTLYGTLFIIAVIASLPHLSGMLAKKGVNQVVTTLNNSPSYKAALVTLEQNYLSTTGQIEIEPVFLNADLGDEIKVLINFDLAHGPILDGTTGWYKGQFFLDNAQTEQLEGLIKSDEDAPLFVSNVYTNLSGLTQFNDKSQALSITTDDGEKLTVSSFDGKGELTRNGNLTYKGQINSVDMQDAETALTFNNMVISTDFELTVESAMLFPIGRSQFSIGAIDVKIDDQAISMQELVFSNSTTDANEATLNIALAASIREIVGFDNKVNDISFKLSFAHISKLFLEEYTSITSQLVDSTPEKEAELSAQLLTLMTSELIPNSPKFALDDLSVTTDKGTFHTDANVSILPSAATVADPADVINHADVSANLKVTKALALFIGEGITAEQMGSMYDKNSGQMTEEEFQSAVSDQTNAMLSMIIAMGWIQEDDTNYTASFSMNQGAATLNGQAIPLPTK